MSGSDRSSAFTASEADFTDRIRASMRVTLLLTGGALIVGVLVGWRTARRIADPIAQLGDAAYAARWLFAPRLAFPPSRAWGARSNTRNPRTDGGIIRVARESELR